MKDNPTLFDSMGLPSLPPLPSIGEERRDAGMKRVIEADPTWNERALLEIEWLIPGQAFDSDLLHELMGDDEPDHPNSYGAAINAATKRDLIEAVGFKKSTRPSANARRILQYVRK